MKKSTHATLQRRQHRKARHTAQRQALKWTPLSRQFFDEIKVASCH
jgi:hypothetical protein